VFEKPLELYSHSNVICMNSLNTVIANAIEKSKLGEAGFVKHDIFSSPTLVEKIRSDDILSPTSKHARALQQERINVTKAHELNSTPSDRKKFK
jgi:hypothetical protein